MTTDPRQDWNEEEAAGNDPIAHLLRLVRDPVGVWRRRWLWMVLACVAGLIATGVFVGTMEPSFVARATVLISSQQIPEDFVRSTVRESSLANLNAMVAQVQSQKNLAALIEEHGLFPDLRDRVSMVALVGAMRGSIQIEEERQIKTTRSPGDRSQIFAISFESDDQDQAALVANELASDFVEAGIERRNQQARQTTEFLRRELNRAEKELRDVNREIAEFQRLHRGEMPGDLETALRKLERLETQRQSLTRRIGDSEERILVLSGKKQEESTPAAAVVELRLKLAEQLGIHTEEHPNVIALRRRIELLEGALDDGQVLSGTGLDRDARIQEERRELQELRADLRRVEEEIAGLDARVDRVPVVGEELEALEQRGGVLRENYLEFLRKVQDAELAQTLESAQQGPRVTVLDRANRPGAPVRPPLLFGVGGVLGAFVLAVVVGVLLELLDPVVLTSDQLEPIGMQPLLGEFPRA